RAARRRATPPCVPATSSASTWCSSPAMASAWNWCTAPATATCSPAARCTWPRGWRGAIRGSTASRTCCRRRSRAGARFHWRRGPRAGIIPARLIPSPPDGSARSGGLLQPDVGEPPVTQPAILVLEDGTVFEGDSVGAPGLSVGEVVFNTAMTGYQEIVTDPSYARQIVTLTYPHVGNTGCTAADDESTRAWAAGLIVRDVPRRPSSWSSEIALPDWLPARGVVALSRHDTPPLTRQLRVRGALDGALMAGEAIDPDAAIEAARKFPGLKGMDLAKETCTREAYEWSAGELDLDANTFADGGGRFKVVAYDFGTKLNILRMLAGRGCD